MTSPSPLPAGPEQAQAHDGGHGLLTRLHESMATRLIRELAAVDVQHGQRILDVGAGAGTVTDHLVKFVGPHGGVVAVDVDTDLLQPTSVIDVYRRNVRTEPLPGDPGGPTTSSSPAASTSRTPTAPT